jgi:hypothetical protein
MRLEHRQGLSFEKILHFGYKVLGEHLILLFLLKVCEIKHFRDFPATFKILLSLPYCVLPDKNRLGFAARPSDTHHGT